MTDINLKSDANKEDGLKNNDLAISKKSEAVYSEIKNVKQMSEGFISGLCSATVVSFGFAFVFFGQWAFGDDPWNLRDLFIIIPLTASVIILAFSCLEIFSIKSLNVTIDDFLMVRRYYRIGMRLLLLSLAVSLVCTLLPTDKFEGSVQLVRELRVGVTKISDVSGELGPYSKKSEDDDGGLLLEFGPYFPSYVTETTIKQVSMSFDKNGVLRWYNVNLINAP